MNKIDKLLKKLNARDRLRIEQVLLKLLSDQLESLDIKRLKNTEDLYRVRVGQYRVIYRYNSSGKKLIDISKRDEKTYKNL